MFEFPGDHESDWISIIEFSRRYEIPKRTLSRWVSAGKIRSVRYSDTADAYYLHARQAYEELRRISPLKYGSDEQARSSRSGARRGDEHSFDNSLEAAKAETARLKNEILKLDLEARIGKILPRDIVESIETDYMSRLKAILLQTPGQIAREMGVDEKAVQMIVERALNQFAEQVEVKKKRYQEYLTRSLSKPS